MALYSKSLLALALAQYMAYVQGYAGGDFPNLGCFPYRAATSCQQILQLQPYAPSGNYWIWTNSGPTYISCNMNCTECGHGAWTAVTSIDMTKSGSSCPSGLQYFKSSSKAGCRKNTNRGCSSVTFTTYETSYSKICGKIVGYQHGTPDAFKIYHVQKIPTRLEDQYVDGISLTFNSPKEHIWTFTSMPSWFYKDHENGCPGKLSNTSHIPSFISRDYFCETGVDLGESALKLHTEQPLWDGVGVGTFPSGFDGMRSPWFVKKLPNLVKKNINMRVCMDENRDNEDILIEKIFFYVQ